MYSPISLTDLFGDDKIIHVQELMDFLAVFTNDKRYKDIKTELMKIKNEGRPVKMCHVAQALEEKGIKQGIERGIECGIKQERLNAIQRMLLKGLSKETILDLGYTEKEYAEVENKLLEYTS